MQNAKSQIAALDSLQQVVTNWLQMTDEPYIIARLIDSKKAVRVVLEEVWPDNDIGTFSSSKLDAMVSWTENTLTTWTTATRMSWDSWNFSSKKEAEKFVILYNLRWAQ